ncbi:MAG TPA: HlyD family efflux transporter periplasmic adaptor subunit [Anaerolineae bacterium]|nr:HlyD family efflux transporter periplasmic adaptor subunit [Anaerolineae bacterium]
MKKIVLPALGLALVLIIAVLFVLGSVPAFGEKGEVANASEAATPTLPPAPRGVVAEGVVVPERHAALSMAAGGVVAEILVEEGATVEAGQPILRLQDAHQRAAVAEARAALASVEAQYANLEAGARSQEIAAAEAGLEGARARLARLQEGARPEGIAAAEAALQAAQATLDRLYEGPDEQARIAAEAELANAEAVLQQAQAAYDVVAGRDDVGMLPESLQLQQATNAYEATRARYDALFDEPEAHVVAGARAQIKEAQATLELLRKPVTANEIDEAEAMVRQAEAERDLLQAGARSEDLDAAAAAVDQARAAVQQAEAGLADTELRAPFSGTLARLYVKVGELAAPGAPVVVLADLSSWQIETDDLTELDVVSVAEGDEVALTFDAIPGLALPGQVLRVKPMGEEKLGDVTYTVVVVPHEQDSRLKWGMTAVVTLP